MTKRGFPDYLLKPSSMKLPLLLALSLAAPVALAPTFTPRTVAAENSPLEKAIFKNDVAAAKTLIEAPGFDANAKSEMGYYPLPLAAQFDRVAIMKMLLALPGADPNQFDGDKTPLGYAMFDKGTGMLATLLAHPKTDVNLAWGDDKTAPIHAALAQNRTDALKLLLARPDLNVNLPDGSGQSPLQLAVQNNAPAQIALLLATKRVRVNTPDKVKRTAHRAPRRRRAPNQNAPSLAQSSRPKS